VKHLKQYKIRSLESKHILSTVLFLGEHGTATKTELYENVSKNPRMPDKLRELESLGLIVIREGYPTYVELTSKGAEIYEVLKNVELLM
jgi:predicted transcriptional regulator